MLPLAAPPFALLLLLLLAFAVQRCRVCCRYCAVAVDAADRQAWTTSSRTRQAQRAKQMILLFCSSRCCGSDLHYSLYCV
jgi:hypothetical protein